MIGILPAAGSATRIHGLPKFMLPIPDGVLITRMSNLLQRQSDVIIVGARYPSLDFGFNASIPMFDVGRTRTMTETVLRCRAQYEDVDTHDILFAMPDTFVEDEDAFSKLANALDAGADLAVGIFSTRPGQERKLGMVSAIGDKILEVLDKPTHSSWNWAWGVLAWKPVFWGCLDASMPHVGYGIPVAMERGLNVKAVRMRGQFFDCGTPEEYFDLICQLHCKDV